jgi:uncharacterized protein
MNRIAWVDIPVTDLERAVAFYSALLGEGVERQAGAGYVVGLLPAARGGAGARLVRDPSAPHPPPATGNAPSRTGPLVYLSVPGRLRAASRIAREHGGEVLADAHSMGEFGWRAIILDSEGNRIALHSSTDT